MTAEVGTWWKLPTHVLALEVVLSPCLDVQVQGKKAVKHRSSTAAKTCRCCPWP